jgi:hypothetical protein
VIEAISKKSTFLVEFFRTRPAKEVLPLMINVSWLAMCRYLRKREASRARRAWRQTLAINSDRPLDFIVEPGFGFRDLTQIAKIEKIIAQLFQLESWSLGREFSERKTSSYFSCRLD